MRRQDEGTFWASWYDLFIHSFPHLTRPVEQFSKSPSLGRLHSYWLCLPERVESGSVPTMQKLSKSDSFPPVLPVLVYEGDGYGWTIQEYTSSLFSKLSVGKYNVKKQFEARFQGQEWPFFSGRKPKNAIMM